MGKLYKRNVLRPEGKYWQYNPDVENAKENRNVVPLSGGRSNICKRFPGFIRTATGNSDNRI